MVYTLRDSLHYFPINRSKLVEQMEKGPFSLATDGSNDEGLVKLNLILIRLFDNDLCYVHVQLLDMCCSKPGTAEILFENIPSALRSNEIDWSNCVRLSLQNTSSNLGRRNSIKTRVQEVNNLIFINGCPCHIVHNTGNKGAEYKVANIKQMVLMLRKCFLIYSIGLIKGQKEKSSLKSFALSVTGNTVKS